mmetsp:Transcript_10105/g.29875  ORF Transcript_10105/g.29875 Transcript_10105/m.29875 type:complete len:528 (-) Transcript_10105:181-1764(-)
MRYLLTMYMLLSLALVICVPTTNAIELVKKKAVVIGGGPAGLASALVLARHHDYQVTVLEKSLISTEYQRSKAYFYNINERGQALTKRFPSLQKRIVDNGVGITRFSRYIVPGDPDKPFDPKPVSRPQTPEERRKFGTFYWVPRHTFVKLLLEEVRQDKNIELCTGESCRDIRSLPDGTLHVETTAADDRRTALYEASLVVGSDGLKSKVREVLASNENTYLADKWSSSSYRPEDFELIQYESPSTGLRIKTLQLQPNFTIPVGDGIYEPLNTTANYAIESVNKGRTNKISMILLPARNATAIRPIAICTLSNHDVWKIDNGEDMKVWFQKAFPRFDFSMLVGEEEWDAFAKSQGSRFPLCQYCPRASVHNNENSGIVLVGDALHAFPPDLGQGVNAALADVAVLDDCLSQDDSLPEALDRYRSLIEPETKALIQLARVGAPYQYRQSSYLLAARRYLWTANILVRIILNKLTRGWTPQPAVMQMMDSQLSFRTIMKRANQFSTFLWSVLIATLGLVLKMGTLGKSM